MCLLLLPTVFQGSAGHDVAVPAASHWSGQSREVIHVFNGPVSQEQEQQLREEGWCAMDVDGVQCIVTRDPMEQVIASPPPAPKTSPAQKGQEGLQRLEEPLSKAVPQGDDRFAGKEGQVGKDNAIKCDEDHQSREKDEMAGSPGDLAIPLHHPGLPPYFKRAPQGTLGAGNALRPGWSHSSRGWQPPVARDQPRDALPLNIPRVAAPNHPGQSYPFGPGLPEKFVPQQAFVGRHGGTSNHWHNTRTANGPESPLDIRRPLHIALLPRDSLQYYHFTCKGLLPEPQPPRATDAGAASASPQPRTPEPSSLCADGAGKRAGGQGLQGSTPFGSPGPQHHYNPHGRNSLDTVLKTSRPQDPQLGPDPSRATLDQPSGPRRAFFRPYATLSPPQLGGATTRPLDHGTTQATSAEEKTFHRWLGALGAAHRLLGAEVKVEHDPLRAAKCLNTLFSAPLPHIAPPSSQFGPEYCSIILPVAALGTIAHLQESSFTKLMMLLAISMGSHGAGATQTDQVSTHHAYNTASLTDKGATPSFHPNEAPRPMFSWNPYKGFQKRYTAMADLAVSWFEAQALWGAQSEVRPLSDLFQYRLGLDLSALARIKHNSQFYLDNLSPVHQYRRSDGFSLPYPAAPYEILAKKGLTFEQCEQLAISTNSSLPHSFAMLNFVNDHVTKNSELQTYYLFWLESAMTMDPGSSPPNVTLSFDNITLFPPDRNSEIYCPVVVSRQGSAVTLPRGHLPMGYTWYEPRHDTYHEEHMFRFRLGATPDFQSCQILTPLKNGEYPPKEYELQCALMRNPVESQLQAYWLDRQKEELLKNFQALPLDVEKYRIDYEHSQPALPLSDLEIIPTIHHGQAVLLKDPPLLHQGDGWEPHNTTVQDPVITQAGFLPASAIRPLEGSAQVQDFAPEAGHGDPAASSLLAHPVIGSLAASAGGFIIRGLAGDAATKYVRLATEQARYRALDPWRVERVMTSDSPQTILDEISGGLANNMTLIRRNNVILMKSLVKDHLLDPDTVLFDAHFRAGLQAAASNLALLREALEVVDDVAIQAGLAALSAHHLALRPEGPALVSITKSDSFYLLHFFLATVSPKTDTRFRFFALPSYSTGSPGTALFLNLPRSHRLSPYPEKNNISIVQSTCADNVLSSSFDVNGVIQEEFCQYEERAVTLVSVLHTAEHGQLLLVTRLSATKVNFFLTCLDKPAVRFASGKDVNIFFLPLHCSLRVSAHQKLVNLPARTPHHRFHEQRFLWVYSYNIQFRPFALTKSQRFEALMLAFVLTACSVATVLIYLAVKFRAQIRMIWQARHRHIRSASPSPPPPPMALLETTSYGRIPARQPRGGTPPPSYWGMMQPSPTNTVRLAPDASELLNIGDLAHSLRSLTSSPLQARRQPAEDHQPAVSGGGNQRGGPPHLPPSTVHLPATARPTTQ